MAGYFGPEKLQNHTNEGKRKEIKEERGEGKEEKKKLKAMVALLVFIVRLLWRYFLAEEQNVGRKIRPKRR